MTPVAFAADADRRGRCRARPSLRQAPRVSAFAISASFGVRNPEHELQLRALVERLCDKPVTCGHELASSLGAPRRALTVALNARMVSHVKALIDAVRQTLAQHRIDAPLMMVQGDGTPGQRGARAQAAGRHGVVRPGRQRAGRLCAQWPQRRHRRRHGRHHDRHRGGAWRPARARASTARWSASGGRWSRRSRSMPSAWVATARCASAAARAW